MADVIKVLAQLLPSANSLSTLYTVPGATTATISSIVICNQNFINSILFRVSVAISNESDSLKQYIYYDMPLSPNDTFIATVGITLSTGDVIRVRSDTINVSFSLFGVEII